MTNKTKNYKYSIKLKFDNQKILMLIDYPRRLTAPRLFYSVPIIRIIEIFRNNFRSILIVKDENRLNTLPQLNQIQSNLIEHIKEL